MPSSPSSSWDRRSRPLGLPIGVGERDDRQRGALGGGRRPLEGFSPVDDDSTLRVLFRLQVDKTPVRVLSWHGHLCSLPRGHSNGRTSLVRAAPATWLHGLAAVGVSSSGSWVAPFRGQG